MLACHGFATQCSCDFQQRVTQYNSTTSNLVGLHGCALAEKSMLLWMPRAYGAYSFEALGIQGLSRSVSKRMGYTMQILFLNVPIIGNIFF